MRAIVLVASVLGFALVATAAAGAHLVLADIRAVDPQSPLLRQWDQAILFGLMHVLAALVAAALPTALHARVASGWLFVAGIVLFSGVQVLRIAGVPAPAFLVPVGGLALMAGWLALALSAVIQQRRD